MRTILFSILSVTLSFTAYAGEFASSCRKADPDGKYLGSEIDVKGLEKCAIKGYGAHYPISVLQELEAACLREADGKRLTVAADAALVNGKPKAELFLFCWPPQ